MTQQTSLFQIVLAGLVVSTAQAVPQQILWEFEGITSDDQFGTSVGVVGDVDADGFADVIASSRFERGTPMFDSPYVRVFSGRSGAILHEFRGNADEDEFGRVATGAGDVNGDGHADVLVSSSRFFSSSSNLIARVYIYSGATGARLLEISETAQGFSFGVAVVAAGDVDGDGFDDVAIGDSCESNCSGAVRVYSGSTGALLWRTVGPERESLGSALANIGDVNGDGVAELAVSAVIPGLFGMGGRVRVLSGANGAILTTAERSDTVGPWGIALAPLGDIDGDGSPEFVVGTFTQRDGLVSIVSADDGTILRDQVGGSFEDLGKSVAGGDDVDGDGVPDYAAGGSGFAALFSGASGNELYRVTGENGDNFLGGAVALVGDTNGDGYGEFVVGGPRDNSIGLGSGTVYVHTRNAPNGGTLCLGTPNSTGSRATLQASSPSDYLAAANDLTLSVSGLPPFVFGYFVVSREFLVLPSVGGGEGNLCIASLVMGRYTYAVNQASALGAATYSPSTLAIPLGTSAGSTFVSALPGETFNFQFWHRDVSAAGAPTFNFSDAVTVAFR